MKPEVAALKIQGFFTSYRLKKQQALGEAISTNPAAQLLKALDLRFQCMRAVAAAKLPIAKPIEDRAQVIRVIECAQELARERGITNLEAVERLFLQNITLAENIQSPYYHLIWTKCHDGERDLGKLVNNAYQQLCQLVLDHELSVACDHEKTIATPEEVLGLARDIIQYASRTIVDELANPDLCEYYGGAQEDLERITEQMLSNYMMPRVLSESKEGIHSLVEGIKDVIAHQPHKF